MRYFISFLIALGLLALVIFLLFSGGGKVPQKKLTAQNIVDYSTSDAQAILTIDGPVNAVQNHQQVRITVGSDNVTFEQLQGYSGNDVVMRNFANDSDSYAVFLKSLAHAGFTLGNSDPRLADERGICSLGDRYILQFRQDNQDLERYWATSCGGGAKTYQGVLNLTVSLFTAQVPGYQDLTQKLNF